MKITNDLFSEFNLDGADRRDAEIILRAVVRMYNRGHRVAAFQNAAATILGNLARTIVGSVIAIRKVKND